MAKPREIPGLSGDDSYGTAAAQVVEVRAQEMSDHSVGVLDVSDIERVHDMRVASRRLRAALEIFEPCFPAKRFGDALEEVKALADALGERRDRDVAIASLEQFADGLPLPDQPGVRSLIERMRAEQEHANGALAPFVSPEHLDALGERLSELVAAAEQETDS